MGPCYKGSRLCYEAPILHSGNTYLVSMMTSSNGNIFRVTGHLWGEFTGPRWIPLTKASDAELWCFLWSRLDKRLSKQSWGWWFETRSRSLWRDSNGQIKNALFLNLGDIFVIHLIIIIDRKYRLQNNAPRRPSIRYLPSVHFVIRYVIIFCIGPQISFSVVATNIPNRVFIKSPRNNVMSPFVNQ